MAYNVVITKEVIGKRTLLLLASEIVGEFVYRLLVGGKMLIYPIDGVKPVAVFERRLSVQQFRALCAAKRDGVTYVGLPVVQENVENEFNIWKYDLQVAEAIRAQEQAELARLVNEQAAEIAWETVGLIVSSDPDQPMYNTRNGNTRLGGTRKRRWIGAMADTDPDTQAMWAEKLGIAS